MQWIIVQDSPTPVMFWKETDSRAVGVSGEWVADRSKATRYSDSRRLQYIADKGSLPTGFTWRCLSRRFQDALDVQSAVNPSGIALSLHEAFREVIAEGGDTRAMREDPACRLIAHQLAGLMGMSGGYDFTDYRKYVEACEAKVAAEKRAEAAFDKRGQ